MITLDLSWLAILGRWRPECKHRLEQLSRELLLDTPEHQVAAVRMTYVSECEAHLLALHSFELVSEHVELRADNHNWHGHGIHFLSVLVLLPVGFDSLLVLIELLLVLRGQLGLKVLGWFGQLFTDGGQPEEKGVHGGSWVREVYHDADYDITASKCVAVQGCLK